jgi:endogenous inhibitor of DNA gyrase (YacG/DUF329 family)
MPQLEPWMLKHGAPDVNPTICPRCGNTHSRVSAFCSHRCRRAWNSMKRREQIKAEKAKGVKPATLEELL